MSTRSSIIPTAAAVEEAVAKAKRKTWLVGGVLISREPRKDEINLDLVSLLNSLNLASYKAFRLSELDHTPMTIICHF